MSNDQPQRPARPQLPMTGRMLFIGRFFGVPLYFAPSWLLFAGILTVYYGPIVRDAAPDTSKSTAYLVAFGFACAFAVCVLVHELGHTAMALALRTPVIRVVIFFLGGVSELGQDPKRPREEFLVAAAGPFASLLLCGVSALGWHLTGRDTLPSVFFGLLFWSNLLVVIFNVLPALPLDGGRLLRSAVWAVTHDQALGTTVGGWAGRVLAVLVAFCGVVLDRTVMSYAGGLVCLAIAVYLWVGGTQTLRYARLQRRLPAVDLERLLRPGLLVPADLSVAEALRRAWEGHARGLVIVDSADRPQAIVDEAMIGSVPPERRPWTPLGSVARTLEAGLVLPRGMSGEDLLNALRNTPAHEYLVVNPDGSPAGILAASDLAAILTGQQGTTQ